MTTFMRESNAFFKERGVRIGWKKTPLDRYVWWIFAVGTFAVFVNTLHAVSVPNPKMSNLVVMLVAAGLCVANGLRLIKGFRTPLYAYRRDVFKTSVQAGYISVEVQKTLHTLGAIAANTGFDSGMYNLSSHATTAKKTTQSSTTPAGYTFDSSGYLPADNDSAFKIVMREALYAWLVQQEYLGPEDPNDFFNDNMITDISSQKIPVLAQEYILLFFEDLVLVNPLRFDNAHLEQYKHGLGNVVDALTALECSATETVARANDWNSSGTFPSPAQTSVSLPGNLA